MFDHSQNEIDLRVGLNAEDPHEAIRQFRRARVARLARSRTDEENGFANHGTEYATRLELTPENIFA